MTRRALRTTLVTLGLCTIAACVVNISFDMPQTVQVSSAPGVTSIHQVKSVNLQDYSEVRDHKDPLDQPSPAAEVVIQLPLDP